MTPQQEANLNATIKRAHDFLANSTNMDATARDITIEHLLGDLHVILGEIDPLLAKTFDTILTLAYTLD